MRSTRGQATVEHVGLVLLLAALVTAMGGAAAGGGDALAGGVVRQIRYALCLVTGGDCDRDRAPCPTTVATQRDGWRANLGIVRLGGERVLVREERSDGSVVLTEARSREGGLEGGAGLELDLSRLRPGLGVQGTVGGGFAGVRGGGRSWVARDARSAAAVERALREGREPAQRPTARSSEDGWRVRVGGTGGRRPVTGRLEGAYETLEADVVDEGAGERVTVLRRRITGEATLAALGLGGEGDGEAEWTLALTTDSATGALKDLGLSRTWALDGSGHAPGALERLAGRELRVAGGRMAVVERHLDLTRPDARAAAERFVATLAHDANAFTKELAPYLAGAREDLGRLLDERGVVHHRLYGLDREGDGLGLVLGSGGKIGGGRSREQIALRLLAAETRGADGVWREREDCVATRA